MWRINRRMWRETVFDNHRINSKNKIKEQRMKLALWDGVMVVLHKINNDHDARVMDMMQAGDRYCGCP